MNYKQQLIHEALQELEGEYPSLLTHVTDVSSDWEDKHRDVVFYVVFKGAAFIIKHCKDQKYWYAANMHLWGIQATVKKDPVKRRKWVDYVKVRLLSTIQHAEKVMAEKERLGLKYPSLTS